MNIQELQQDIETFIQRIPTKDDTRNKCRYPNNAFDVKRFTWILQHLDAEASFFIQEAQDIYPAGIQRIVQKLLTQGWTPDECSALRIHVLQPTS